MITAIKKAEKPRHQYILKACARCHGDLVLRGDIYGDYYNCIQCGAEFDPAALTAATPAPAKAA